MVFPYYKVPWIAYRNLDRLTGPMVAEDVMRKHKRDYPYFKKVADYSSSSSKKNKMPPTTRARAKSRGRSKSRSMSKSRSRVRSMSKKRAKSVPARNSKGRFMKKRFVASSTKYTVGKKVKIGGQIGKFEKQTKSIRKGSLIQTTEFGGAASTAAKTFQVGFGTASEPLRLMLWQQIIINLLRKAGQNIRSVFQSASVTLNDKITVRYVNVTNVVDNVEYNCSSTDTVSIIASWFANDAATAVLRQESDVRLMRISYNPVANSVGSTTDYSRTTMELDNAVVEMYVKQNFKMQNRTVEVAEDRQSDEVDNVPLEGKVYAAYKGQLRFYRADNDAGGTHTYTAIKPAAATGIVPFTGLAAEPMQPGYFLNNYAAGSFRINPGKIQTHSLIVKKKLSLWTFYKHLLIALTGSNDGTFPLGAVKVIQMEKFIDTGSTQSISIGWELNNYYSLNLICKQQKKISPLFTYTNIP